MSFNDDLLEPEAIDSAADFFEVVRVATESSLSGAAEPRTERLEPKKRALPRELGN